MKKLLFSLIFAFSVISAFAQQGSQALSGVFFRVQDTVAYQAAAATRHSQNYHDIYWNEQATTPHWDIWNGSSYDHVFDFNSGGGAGLVDGDYGDVTVGGIGTTMTIDNLAVTNAKINDVAASKVTGGAAISVTDDTNYDLTLTGSPTTSLLQAVGITIGHSGVFGVSRGGTGTGTQFTPGSVLFATTSGVYAQDNSNLFWDDTNNRLGLGVNTSLGSQLNFKAQSTTANTAIIEAAAGSFETMIRAGLFEYGTRWAVTGSNLVRTTLGGAIADYITDVNNSGTTETDIYSTTLKTNTLSTNSDKITFRYVLTHNDATATGQIKVYFGGSVIADFGALTFSGTDDIVIEGFIIRESSTIIKSFSTFRANNSTPISITKYTRLTGLTLGGTNVIKITAQAGGGGGGSNDITGRTGSLFIHPASAN